ncbi:MAG TPA: hypothetical protein VI756_16790 [Blastocatellia bacterium]
MALHLKNVGQSSRTFFLNNGPWYQDFTLVVTDARGTAIPRKLDPSETDPSVITRVLSVIPIPIEPGKEIRADFANLKEFFALVPGRSYFVTASRAMPSAGSPGPVALLSNTLEVDLDPGPPSQEPHVAAATNGGGGVTEGTELLIDSSSRWFLAGGPVDLTLHLKSIRAEGVEEGWVGGSWCWHQNGIRLDIRDGSGNQIGRRPEVADHDPTARAYVAGERFHIPLGSELRITLSDLRDYFELVPGVRHFVTATWEVSVGDGRSAARVTSNKVEVGIAPN